jgi:hypothetical protein
MWLVPDRRIERTMEHKAALTRRADDPEAGE